MLAVTREHLVQMISYAISRNVSLLPRRRTIADSAIFAEAIVKHLDLCHVTVVQPPPAPLHRTPAE